MAADVAARRGGAPRKPVGRLPAARQVLERQARGGAPLPSERPDHDLVAAIRAELAAVEPARACCRVAERAGLGAAARGRARSPVVARLAVRLDRSRSEAPAFDWAGAADHCRIAYLRGRFLAGGSLSLASGRTHLEFVVPTHEVAAFAERLAGLGLPAAWRLRRGSGVVTWKGAESVTRFLRRCGASASLLELEARLVSRSLRGDLNRLINAEQANLERSVSAAARQSAAIETLAAAGILARLPDIERTVADARRESPEASLTELAARLGLARAHVQRVLARLESLALDAHDPAGRAGPR